MSESSPTLLPNVDAEKLAAETRTGYLLLIAEDVVWGLYPVLVADLTRRYDPLLVAGVSALSAAIPFWLVLARRGLIHTLWDPAVRGTLVAIALTATVLSSLFFFVGASATTGLNASLLSQVEPVYSLFLAGIFLKEVITKSQIAATLLLLLGAVAIMWQDGLTFQRGDLLVVLTPLWYQIGHMLAKRIFPKLAHPYAVPAVRMGLGGTILLSLALVQKPELASSLLDPVAMAPLVLFGLVLVGAEKLLWYEALRRIDLAKATALLVPSVGVGVLGAWVIMGEKPRESQWLGFVLMLVGLSWLAYQGLRPRRRVG